MDAVTEIKSEIAKLRGLISDQKSRIQKCDDIIKKRRSEIAILEAQISSLTDILTRIAPVNSPPPVQIVENSDTENANSEAVGPSVAIMRFLRQHPTQSFSLSTIYNAVNDKIQSVSKDRKRTVLQTLLNLVESGKVLRDKSAQTYSVSTNTVPSNDVPGVQSELIHNIKSALMDGPLRKGVIAERVGVSSEKLEEALREIADVSCNERGWYSYAST